MRQETPTCPRSTGKEWPRQPGRLLARLLVLQPGHPGKGHPCSSLRGCHSSDPNPLMARTPHVTVRDQVRSITWLGRIGRGRDDRAPQARPQQHRPSYGQQAPQGGQQPYGYPPAQQQPYGGERYSGGRQYSGGQPGWPQANGGGAGGHGEPEEFSSATVTRSRALTRTRRTALVTPRPSRSARTPTPRRDLPRRPGGGPADRPPSALEGPAEGHRRSQQTFLQMRDYTMWAPALIVTFLYGLLAIPCASTAPARTP